MVRSADIPQATVETVVRVVKAVADGAANPDDIAQASSLARRQVDYGLRAASVLGFISEATANGFQVENVGRRMAAAQAKTETFRKAWREAIAASDVLTAVSEDLLGEQPPQASALGERISALTGLSLHTATHRARMLLKWRHHVLRAPVGSSGMWRRVTLKNYRSIQSADLVLAPFCVVVGRNGAGKSNFADALVFLRDVASDARAAVEARGGVAGLRRHRPSRPADVTIDVRVATSEEDLESNYVRHSLVIGSGKAGDWYFKKEFIAVVAGGQVKTQVERDRKTLTIDKQGSFEDLAETSSAMLVARQLKSFRALAPLMGVRRYRLSPEAMRASQSSTDETRLAEKGENIAVAIRSLRERPGFEELVTAMAKVVPGLLDISYEQVGRNLALKFRQSLGENHEAEFYASEMSDGALRTLGIMVACAQMTKDELLVIEEPEASVHAGAAQLLFELLDEASHRGAVLVTTHSAELLDAAQEREIIVCEYEHGATKLGELARAQRELIREGLFSLAELVKAEPLRREP